MRGIGELVRSLMRPDLVDRYVLRSYTHAGADRHPEHHPRRRDRRRWRLVDVSGEGTDQSDVIEAVQEEIATTDALLVGRVTFEQLRGYWPLQTEDPTGVRDHLNQVPKYVLSRPLQDPSWERTTVLRGPLLDAVRELKSQPGKGIVVTGSMSLMPELITGGMVDEYRLFVYPMVLGRGRRLFADATGLPGLRLAEARPFRSGIVLLRYRTAADRGEPT